MFGALSKFNIPPATQNISQGTSKYGSQTSQSQKVPIQKDDPINIDPNQIPDYVYNEDASGYASMFSPLKIGITNRKGTSLFLPK
jgi:hypothetical protein